jgi:hypothetical protein
VPGGTAVLSMMVKRPCTRRKLAVYACTPIVAVQVAQCLAVIARVRRWGLETLTSGPRESPTAAAKALTSAMDAKGLLLRKSMGSGDSGGGAPGELRLGGRRRRCTEKRAQRERQQEQRARRLLHHSAHKRACLPGEGEEGAKAVDEGATRGVDGEVERKGNLSSTKRTS